MWRCGLLVVLVTAVSGAAGEGCDKVCQNGGTLREDVCECTCLRENKGELCEETLCGPPCENGGTMDMVTCTCSCPDGWYGALCADECTITCENFGRRNAACGCDCPPGFTGDRCQTPPPCGIQCEHGGLRVDDNCSCTCPDTWTGHQCEICSRQCGANGFLLDALCLCSCRDGFTGDSCEIPPPCDLTCTSPQTLDNATCTCTTPEPCDRVCENDGLLVESVCVCSCAYGFTGKSCEICDVTCSLPQIMIEGKCECKENPICASIRNASMCGFLIYGEVCKCA
ncbi:neurogenic locus notch homolog protein 1-like [Haliotis rufescens]|uniref:neurogenic locus notch homolog protein 1-like n=1 Tax=Haliotis rufescens TaxID=6454 RepID=UPI00201F5D77|nr:neurogenic locus notch homolog protein 1-like [Haliotis rufescens]